jgi:outer membrane lipoprotein-sorting protein
MKKISFMLIAGWVFALTGDELSKKIDQRKMPLDSKVDLIMTLKNKKGKTRSSSLRSIVKDNGEKQIIWFLSPADDKGVAFLKIEHNDKNDEMRIWLPAFKKVRRISAKTRSDSFMGSDMSYEDMSTRQLNEFIFNIIGEEVYDSTPCYLLESVPRDHIRTEYSQHITWVDTSLFLPLKEKSYDKSGELLKEKYFFYSHINGYDVLSKIKVKDVQKDHTTNLTFENIELDTGIKDKLFHEMYLKRLPK